MSSSAQTPGSGPAAKRRRIDLASATLKKPFRSPLLTRKGVPPSPSPSLLRRDDDAALNTTPGHGEDDEDGDDDDTAGQGSPSVSRTTTTTIATTTITRVPDLTGNTFPMRQGRGLAVNSRRYTTNSNSNSNSNSNNNNKHPTATSSNNNNNNNNVGQTPQKRPPPLSSTPKTSRNTRRRTNPAPTNQHISDDALLSQLAKAQKARQASLAQIQKQLDLIRQARRIEERSSLDGELEGLVAKWRAASRQAAEELFELIRGRVDGMGGSRAWKESRRRGRGWDNFGSGGDDDDDGMGRRRRRGGGNRGGRGGDNGGGGGDEEYEEEEGLRGEIEGHEEGGEDDGCGREKEGEEETGFTMLMMLQSLNIDPDILGYDRVEEKWQE